jgi:hypothetical protein
MNFRVLQAVPFCRAFSSRLHLLARESPPLLLVREGVVFFVFRDTKSPKR